MFFTFVILSLLMVLYITVVYFYTLNRYKKNKLPFWVKKDTSFFRYFIASLLSPFG